MEQMVKYENGVMTIEAAICQQIALFKQKALEIELKEKELKQKIKECMEAHGVTEFENDYFKVSYRKASTRTMIDTKKLKEELPDIYEAYTKTSQVGSSITMEVK